MKNGLTYYILIYGSYNATSKDEKFLSVNSICQHMNNVDMVNVYSLVEKMSHMLT